MENPTRDPFGRRLSGLDMGRVVAIVLVISQHISGPLSQARDTAPPIVWLTGLVVQSVARFSVPLFVMISGALMLRSSNESVAEFYTRRFHRIAVPALAWILIYYALTYTYLGYTFRSREVVIGLLRGLPYNHLYFIYAIVGLYALTPILRVTVRSLTRSQLNLFVGLAIGWAILDLVLRVEAGLRWTNSAVTWSIVFLGYYLLGHRLFGLRLSCRGAWLAAFSWLLAAVASIVMLVLVVGTPFEKYSFVLSNVYSPFVVVMAASAFMLLPRLEVWFLRRFVRMGKALPTLATLTFGVYLLHEVFVAALYKEYAMTIATDSPILWMIVTVLGVGVLSFILVWILSFSRVTSWLFGLDIRPRASVEPAGDPLEPAPAILEDFSRTQTSDTDPIQTGSGFFRWYVAGATLLMLLPVAVVVMSTQKENSLPQAKVVLFKQGGTSLGLPVPPWQSRPTAAVERYDDSNEESVTPSFCSLGLGGELIVEMAGGMVDGAGDDLLVVEKTWGAPTVVERARVYVGDDLKNWRYLGMADNALATETSPDAENRFDIGAAGISSARYVRLVDATIPSGSENVNGFDVSLITALHPAGR